jgi:hypothetical protein
LVSSFLAAGAGDPADVVPARAAEVAPVLRPRPLVGFFLVGIA